MSSFEDLRKMQARQKQEEARKLEERKRAEAERRENQYRYNQAMESAERARQSFSMTQEGLFWFLCGNGVYTDSFFSKIVLKVFPGKYFTIL